MTPAFIHGLFEALAWVLAVALSFQIRRHYPAVTAALPLASARYRLYLLAIWLGALAGAYGLGTANLMLASATADGRSILGAILGGTIAAEGFKKVASIGGSTGAVFVLPLSIAIAVGRIGCFFAGLPDYTFGTPTSLPWGYDFGDGVLRHPVQLYESLAMAGFALWFFIWMRRHQAEAASYGFYIFVGFYGAERFLWEFLKPYPTVLGPLNLFHLACLALVLYAGVMLRLASNVRALA